MGDVNQVTLVGRMGKDPSIRRTQSGKSVMNFSLATNRRVKLGDRWEDKAEWHRVVVWEKTAEYVAERARKGDPLAVVGEIRYGEYTDREGQKRYTSDIHARSVSLFTPRRGDAGLPETSQVEEPIPF